MILYMIDRAGRQRIAELVRAAMGWRSLSGPGIEATGRVSRATVDRVKRGDDKVSNTTLRALGDVLGLPYDFLIYVGTGDREQIEASGGGPDLIRPTRPASSRTATATTTYRTSSRGPSGYAGDQVNRRSGAGGDTENKQPAGSTH